MIIYPADRGYGLRSGRLKAIGYEEGTVSGVTSLSFFASYTGTAHIVAVLWRHENGPSRIRMDGPNPTATVGWPAFDGDELWLSNPCAQALRMIAQGSTNGFFRAIYFTTE